MRLLSGLLMTWVYLCVATLLAQAGLLAVLFQRGLLTPQTFQNLLVIAYDVPVRDMYDQRLLAAQPAEMEKITYAEVVDARQLASLDLDLREMSADKGLVNLHELDSLLEQERDRHTQMKDEFDRRWEELKKDANDSNIQDLRRQIESLSAKLAKDQLLRILDDRDLDPGIALQHVVSIFRSMQLEKRKKIVAEFDNRDAPRLHEILRQIRLGMPQAELIDEARDRLEQFPAKP